MISNYPYVEHVPPRRFELGTSKEQHSWTEYINPVMDTTNITKLAQGTIMSQSPEIRIGDFVVLHSESTDPSELFEPCVYKITGWSKWREYPQAIDITPFNGTYFKDTVLGEQRTISLNEIAHFHNKQIHCEELLEDHSRYIAFVKANRRQERRFKLSLLAKCKTKSNSF